MAEDVTLAAEYLLGVGAYCSPGQLGLMAESNGSIAAASAVNLRPALFAAGSYYLSSLTLHLLTYLIPNLCHRSGD